MKALISPIQDDFVVEVKADNKIFDVAQPLYWIDCSTSIKAYEYKFKNNEFVKYEPEVIPKTAEENKEFAMSLLQATDWTDVADVSDPTKANPYLANVADFVAYRNAVRQYAITPTEGNIDWPTLPQEVWQSV